MFWIRAYILSYILRSWRLVRLGTTRAQRKLFYKMREVERQLKAHGDEAAASPAAVGRALGASESEVIEMDGLLGGRDVSLDAPAPTGEADGRPMIEVLPATDPTPEQTVTEGESAALRRHRLQEALSVLNPRERAIVERRYLSDDPPSLADLGRERGLTRERMRQIEARALGKLRFALERDAPDIIDIAEPAAAAQAA